MVTRALRWATSFRIIAAHLPRIDIFEKVASPADLEAVLAVEALTNPRLLDAANALRLVPPADRVTGPGATFVMAPFAYPHRGRFGDGSYGIYYAARTLATAIAETVHHRAVFLADTSEPPGVFEHRVIEAQIAGGFADAARERNAAALLAPTEYGPSIVFGAHVYAANGDGVVWPSVRAPRGRCVGVFRPRSIRDAHSAAYLGYRWNGAAIEDVFRIESLSGVYPEEPGAE